MQQVIDIGGGQAYGLSADSDNVWAVSYDAGTVARIDPESDSVTATVDLGSGAASAMSTEDDLWVAGYGGAPLFRVDPAAASTTDRFSVGELCCDLTFGNELVWAIDPGGVVKGISPADGTVAAQFDVTLDGNAHSNAVFAGGALWVSSDTTPLHRIDATTGEAEDLDVGGGVPFVAKDGLVWGGSPTEVWAVDETTGRSRSGSRWRAPRGSRSTSRPRRCGRPAPRRLHRHDPRDGSGDGWGVVPTGRRRHPRPDRPRLRLGLDHRFRVEQRLPRRAGLASGLRDRRRVRPLWPAAGGGGSPVVLVLVDFVLVVPGWGCLAPVSLAARVPRDGDRRWRGAGAPVDADRRLDESLRVHRTDFAEGS